jgi:hypothetical protein
VGVLRQFVAMLREQSSKRGGAFETTTCPTCGRDVERSVTRSPRILPGSWWPPTDAERRACCPVHGHSPYNDESVRRTAVEE